MHGRFAEAFEQLVGFPPLKWQRRMFERLATGDVPEVCDLPTGLGKTSVIALWLLALARQKAIGNRLLTAKQGREPNQLTGPRRLRYSAAMPRRARQAPGGYIFHVLNRAAGRRRLFDHDGDYDAFLRVLAEAQARRPCRSSPSA